MILKDTLQEIARRQNAETEHHDTGIERSKLSEIDLKTDHAVVVSGIRRCGKSTLLMQVSKKLKKFYCFNFEDPRAADFELSDFERLNEAFKAEFGKSDYYLFDEIQNVERWELFIRSLLDHKKKVVITGSNASLLSRELGTRLTGRHLRYELLPFSYEEFLKFRKKKASIESFKEYLKNGGFPEYLKEKKVEILHELLNDIVSRDIAVRYGLRNTKVLKELAIYLLTNVGKEFSYNKLKEAFNLGSTNTLIDFISYFEDSYLLFTINKFDHSIRKQQINPKKAYSIDNGMSNANSVTFSSDNGRMLENVVFQQLRRRFKEIFYYRNSVECDFVIKESTKVTLVLQVCYRLTEDNRKREIDGLIEALKEFKLDEGLIITFNQEDTLRAEGKRIRLVPAWKWMSSYHVRTESF